MIENENTSTKRIYLPALTVEMAERSVSTDKRPFIFRDFGASIRLLF